MRLSLLKRSSREASFLITTDTPVDFIQLIHWPVTSASLSTGRDWSRGMWISNGMRNWLLRTRGAAGKSCCKQRGVCGDLPCKKQRKYLHKVSNIKYFMRILIFDYLQILIIVIIVIYSGVSPGTYLYRIHYPHIDLQINML